MTKITDVVKDAQGRPLSHVRVVVDALVSPQEPSVDGVPGKPEVRRLLWRGRTDHTGTWTAELPDVEYTVTARTRRTAGRKKSPRTSRFIRKAITNSNPTET